MFPSVYKFTIPKSIKCALALCLKNVHNLIKTYFIAKGASLVAQLVKYLSAMQETPVQFLGWEDPLEKGYATHSSILGLPGSSAGKESACIAADLGSIPGLGRSRGE